jgi:hypothetical protein
MSNTVGFLVVFTLTAIVLFAAGYALRRLRRDNDVDIPQSHPMSMNVSLDSAQRHQSSEDVLLRAGSIEITTKIARFGGISYQMSNVGSVALYHVRKFNPIAVLMFLAGLAAGVQGANLKGPQADQAQIYFAIAVTLIILSIIVQSFWPKKEFTFIIKTSSNDVYKIVSPNGDGLEAIQRAVETAFNERL